jgi:hypothetical protein
MAHPVHGGLHLGHTPGRPCPPHLFRGGQLHSTKFHYSHEITASLLEIVPPRCYRFKQIYIFHSVTFLPMRYKKHGAKSQNT